MYTAFKQYLLSLKLSPVSRKLYLSDVSRFLTWLGGEPTLDQVSSTSSYTKYLKALENQVVAPSMLKRTTASLKQFGSFITLTYSLPNPVIVGLTPQTSNLKPNFDYIKHFTNYLISVHLSPLTIKSYKSDITRYLDWSTTHLPSTKFGELLSDKNIEIYLNHLSQLDNALESTIERKSKSLARIKTWYHNVYAPNFATDNNNSSSLKGESLETSEPRRGDSRIAREIPDHSPITVKNNNSRKGLFGFVPNFITLLILLVFTATLAIFGYQQFSRDVRLTAAFPNTPVTPNRQLSFQGRLEDAAGTPITTATNLTFKLWDDATVGSQLYSTGVCSLTPDTDGVFSTQIGSTCGSAIASSVFTENANVWLEVTVAAETLSPRQPIASVAYALNSETIQGFPISATVSAIRNTVVPMNQWGEIIVGEQSPRLKGVSGTFQISAPALSFTTSTGTNGNITLAPDGTGQVNVNGNTTSTNFFNVSNAQLTTGSLITGSVANNNVGFKLIDLLSGSSPTSKFSVDNAGNTVIGGTLTLPNSNTLTGVTNYTQFSQGISVGGGTTYYLNSTGDLNANNGTFAGTLQANGTFDANGQVDLGDGGDAITLNGSSITLSGFNCSTYTSGGTLTTNSSGVVQCADDDGGGAGAGSRWQDSGLGSISPINSTWDVLVGGTATSSAKIGLINISSGIPTINLANQASNIAVKDNTASALQILEGSNPYLNLTTTNSSENLSFGNTTTNPTYSFLGSGLTSLSGNLNVNGGTITSTGALAISSGGTAQALTLNAATSGAINIGNTSTGNVLLAGGSGATGCTITNSTGDLVCTGSISGGSIGASTVPFSGITSATNTTAAMVVGTGASLNFSGSGTINASSLLGGTWAIPGTIGSTTPNTGTFTTLGSTGNTTLGDASGDTVLSNSGAWTFANATTIDLANSQTSALNFESGLLNLDTTNSRIGINTTGADRALEINSSTGNNLRLTYNDSNGSAVNYSDFNVSSSGDLTIAPSGGDLSITGNATVSGNITMGGQLQLGRFAATPTAVGAGSMIFNTTTGTNQCYNGSAWYNCGGTLYSNTNASVADGSYITVTHNLASNDLLSSAWINAQGVWKSLESSYQPAIAWEGKDTERGIYHNEVNLYKPSNETNTYTDNTLQSGLLFDTFEDKNKTDSANTTASVANQMGDDGSANYMTLDKRVQSGRVGLAGGQTYATSTTDNASNTYLGSNTVNDIYYYDRSKDSSPDVQVELGIDPNWYNGVTLSVATSSASYSQNGTLADKNPNLTTSYNGSLIKVTGTDSTPRTIFITIKSPTTFDWTNYQGDAATAVTITPGTAQTLGATGVSVTFSAVNYNVGDVFKIASWFIEGSSSTRGTKQQFPERSNIIGTASSMDIIDADTQKLWMRFSEVASSWTYIGYDTTATRSSVSALNGTIYATDNQTTQGSLDTIQFNQDGGKITLDSASGGDFRLSGSIATRGSGQTPTSVNSNLGIVTRYANDVATAVIPNQRTQQVTISGWGYIVATATNTLTETVNLPYKFNNVPSVQLTYQGRNTTVPTSLQDCSILTYRVEGRADAITTNTFESRLSFTDAADGNFGAGPYQCYSWIATGTVSPKQFVTVATGATSADGGTTIINETDGTKADIVVGSQNGAALWSTKTAMAGNSLYTLVGSATSHLDAYYGVHGLQSETSWAQYRNGYYYLAQQPDGWSATGPVIRASATSDVATSLTATANTSTNDSNSNTIYVGTPLGVTVIQEKQGHASPGDGLVESGGSAKWYTKDYISEEGIGDLRGMWPLNNANASSDFEDISVKNNALTGTNITANGDSVSGVRNTATDFDGSTEYMSCTDAACGGTSKLETTGTTWSVGAWVNSSNVVKSNEMIISKATGGDGYELRMSGTTGKPEFSLSTGGVGANVTANQVLVNNTWYHIVATYDGSYKKIYINGQLDNSSATTGAMPDNASAFTIGARSGGTLNWQGYIDEPFVTATALTAAQIMNMYQVGSRALQSHGTGLGGGAADTNQQLGFISTGTSSVGVVAPDWNNQYMYVGTNSTTLGALSKIQLNSDTNIKTYNSSANVPTGGALLVDEDVTSLGVGYNIETVGSAASGVKSMGFDNNSTATSGSFVSKTMTLPKAIGSAVLWMSPVLDSSDGSNTLTVKASNDGGSNYVTCTLVNTNSSPAVPEKEYACTFTSSGTSLKVKFDFVRGSTKTNTYVTQYGISWLGETGFRVEQTDANNVRLYNYSGETQNLKLNVTGASTTSLANPWTDGGTYLYPTGYESIRIYDGTGTNYLGLSHDGTLANFTYNGTTVLSLNSTGDLLPNTDDTQSLGSNTKRWKDLFLGGETAHIGTSTTDEGTVSYDTTGNIFNFGTDSTSNGDIAFFTDDLYLDKSAGSIGIGNTAPNATLDITGTASISGTLTVGNGTTNSIRSPYGPLTLSYKSGLNTWATGLTIQDTTGYTIGQRFVDSSSTLYYVDPADTTSLSINGNIVSDSATFSISSTSNQNITLNAGSGTVQIGAAGAGKLDAGTIDPPYTINGKKFATYMASMTGVKEETTGLIKTDEYINGQGYRGALNFATSPEGSDLWLFAKATNLKESLNSLVVLLSASTNTKTWYKIDPTSGIAYIYSTTPTTVSYRLTAPRFDASEWGNARADGSVGHIINDTSDWDTGVILDHAIDGQDLLLATEDLKTNLISPLIAGQDITVNGPVVIKSSNPDNDGIALTVEGEIDATTISARIANLTSIQAENITAKNIVADTISANHIIGLDAKIASLSAGLSDSEFETITDRIKNRLALLTGNVPSAQDIPTSPELDIMPDWHSDIASTSASIASADIDFATINDYLAVIGTATITDLDVTGSLYTSVLNSKTGSIALATGTMIIDSSGEVAINGNLTVSGKILAQTGEFDTLSLGTPSSATSSALGQLLAIYNEQGQAVATIDASGSANLASLTTNMITIASPGTATQSGLASLLGTAQSNATAGESILVSPNTELTIESPYITPNSLVYLTPTGNTDNKVLFVKSKDEHSFTVAIDSPASSDISFNWWIIQLK